MNTHSVMNGTMDKVSEISVSDRKPILTCKFIVNLLINKRYRIYSFAGIDMFCIFRCWRQRFVFKFRSNLVFLASTRSSGMETCLWPSHQICKCYSNFCSFHKRCAAERRRFSLNRSAYVSHILDPVFCKF